MNELHAPGLTADWLNGWLAAIGVTVLVRGTRLRWTDDPLPVAVFESDGDLVDQIVERLPTVEALQRLVIARKHPESRCEFGRKATIDVYRDRAQLARLHGDSTLAILLTDLGAGEDESLPTSPFNPPVPKGVTLYERVLSCRASIGALDQDRVIRSFEGRSPRIGINGLGFDYRRIVGATDPVGGPWCDPFVELLAFLALGLFPIRGNGHRATGRGWTDRPTRRGAFRWPAWEPALTVPAIDALLDSYWSGIDRGRVITAEFLSVPYRSMGSGDPTRGFASERLAPI